MLPSHAMDAEPDPGAFERWLLVRVAPGVRAVEQCFEKLTEAVHSAEAIGHCG